MATLEQINERLDRIEKLLVELRTDKHRDTISMDEAVIITGYNKSYLYRLTSEKKIPHYKNGRELRFDPVELNAWMKRNKVKSQEEIESEAATYCATHEPK